MKNEKDIKEPYKPEDTPTPPQIIDPVKQNNEPTKEPMNAGKNSGPDQQADRKKDKPGEPEKKGKLLGDETEITDETTI